MFFFLISGHFFSKCTIFAFVTFFYRLVVYPINSIFQCQYVFIRCFCWSLFPLNYQNSYGPQTFQGGNIQRGALTHKTHDISTEWSGWVTWQIKYISAPAEDVSTPNRKDAKAPKVLEALKHDPLIQWPTWVHVNVWKIYISVFMRFIAKDQVGCWL